MSDITDAADKLQPTQIVINRTEKPNSYEFGPSGDRHKIYYDTPAELEQLIKDVLEAAARARQTNGGASQ